VPANYGDGGSQEVQASTVQDSPFQVAGGENVYIEQASSHPVT